MIRLHAIGAAVFALATLALPTFALTHQPSELTHFDTRSQLQDVNLAEVVTTAQAQGDGADGLPTTWCGDETGADNAEHARPRPQFKVVYAYAADRPNRFAGWKDALQANVAIVQRFLSAQDGGTKALRIDMGTRCGPQYVDIQVVALPGARAAYADNFGAISSAVRSALGTSATPRNTIILADGLSGGAQEYGLGETIMGTSGEQPGAHERPQPRRADLDPLQPRRRGRARAPPAGAGGRRASCTRCRTTSAPSSGARRTRRSRSASRSPQYGHCWQGADVMCYAEDAGAAHAMQTDCAAPARRDPAELRLRPRRLLQPGAGAPAPTWRRTGTRTTRPSWRRAARSPRPAAAASCGSRSRRRRRRPRRSPAAPRRGSTLTARVGTWSNGPTELHLPVAAPRRPPAGRTSTARPAGTYVVDQRGPRAPPARLRDRVQPGRQRERRLRPDRADRRAAASTARRARRAAARPPRRPARPRAKASKAARRRPPAAPRRRPRAPRRQESKKSKRR